MRKIIPVLVATCCMWSSAAFALPGKHVMTVSIREDPADEESLVVFDVEMDLVADSVTGSVVKWEIEEMRFTEYQNGFILHKWTVESPTVASGDGLWHVTHADTDNPVDSEFSTLPAVSGTADSNYQGADLDFELESGSLTSTEQTMYSGNVVGMTYTFTKEGASEPVVDGEDEPEQIGVDPDPLS